MVWGLISSSFIDDPRVALRWHLLYPFSLYLQFESEITILYAIAVSAELDYHIGEFLLVSAFKMLKSGVYISVTASLLLGERL